MTAGEPEHGGGAGLVPLDWIMLRAGDVKALLERVSDMLVEARGILDRWVLGAGLRR